MQSGYYFISLFGRLSNLVESFDIFDMRRLRALPFYMDSYSLGALLPRHGAYNKLFMLFSLVGVLISPLQTAEPHAGDHRERLTLGVGQVLYIPEVCQMVIAF